MSARRLLDPRWHMLVAALGQVFDDLEPGDTLLGVGVNAVSVEPGTAEPPEHVAWLVDLPSLDMRKVAVLPGAEDLFAPAMAEGVVEISAPADVAGAEQDGE